MVAVSTITIVLTSCDCYQNVSATVLDRITKQPIDSVYAQKANNNYTHIYSDKNGYFELRSISGGLGGCQPMHVAITRVGYEIKIVEIANGQHDTIYLEKIQ
jgi:hypothetical protein